MRARGTTLLALASVVILSTTGLANDPWDQAPAGFGDDSALKTQNGLRHRSEQIHDVEALGGVADEDWYVVLADSHSSHELVVDDVGGEVYSLGLERRDATGTTVLQTSYGYQLVWQEGVAVPVYYIRLFDAGCTTTCTAASRYRIRLFDTTYSVPRFNNSATQVTLIVVHNADSYAVDATLYFWNAAGFPIGAGEPITLDPNATKVVNTATLQSGAFAGQSGSVSVTNNAEYGRLTGKAVAVEPATGFAFDTAMLPRP